MSYKFISTPQSGNYENGSTDNLTIDSDGRRYKNSNNLERLFDSKSFRIFYFALSTVTLIVGIVCLVMASQMKCVQCEQEIVIVSQNKTEVETLQEMKVFSSPIPRLLNVSFASGPGHVFVFDGVTTTNARWSINFEGKGKLREIRYHFNPRTEEQQIVRNSKTGSKWNTEQRDLCNKEYPFKKGKSFEVKIIVEETKYITYVDGEHYFDYASTSPDPTDIYYIEFSGGVKMNNMTVFEMIAPQL